MREYLIWLTLNKYGVGDKDLVKDLLALIEGEIVACRTPQLCVVLHKTDLGTYLARGISHDETIFEHLPFMNLQEVNKFFEVNYTDYTLSFTIPSERVGS